MKILVTNDDGITAKGIRMLAEVAMEFGDVTVVAPSKPRSAQGHAITIEEPLRLRPFALMEGLTAYECSGTPVDCVKLAKYVLSKDTPFDLCLSGINHGSNASINILYSGTMSAAMEAAVEGIKAVGFSLNAFQADADFEAAKHFARKIIQYVIQNSIAPANLLNVNIPALPLAEIKGIKICRQAEGRWQEKFVEANDPMGRPYHWLSGVFHSPETDEFADHVALNNGWVAVVPVMHDLTQYTAIAGLSDMTALK
jgi:5'-nucleotidase